MMAAIVVPVGDCSIAMTRACFERGSALWVLGSPADFRKGFAALTDNDDFADDDLSDGFLADFAIEILHSAYGGVAAPPKPRIGGQAGGAGSRKHLWHPSPPTVPLQSRRNASPFCHQFSDT